MYDFNLPIDPPDESQEWVPPEERCPICNEPGEWIEWLQIYNCNEDKTGCGHFWDYVETWGGDIC